MNKRVLFTDSGQTLVIFAILVFVFLGMLALILDGGYGYFQRRLAQNAADAGALAGAEVFCETGIWLGEGYAKDVAEKQATEQNYAMEATAYHLDQDKDDDYDEEDRLVQVEASITFDTFFGSILGQDSITAVADATAGCYPPLLLNGVMPVAWSCREPEDDDEVPWDTEDCELLYNDDKYDPLDGQMYLIMDSDKIQEGWEYSHACQDPTIEPPGDRDQNLLDCDIDNDGINDILTGGDRSWLNLTKDVAATPQLRDWIDQVETVTLERHIWAETIDGDKADVFHTLAEHEGEEFILPVYDHLCNVNSKAEPDNPNKLSETKCYNDFATFEGRDSPPDEIYRDINGQHVHVIAYVMFKVTCVSDKPSKICPVKQSAIDQDPPLADHNTLSVEGFFTWGNVVGANGGPNPSAWFGVWKVYLID